MPHGLFAVQRIIALSRMLRNKEIFAAQRN